MDCLFCKAVATSIVKISNPDILDLDVCQVHSKLSIGDIVAAVNQRKDSWTEQQVIAYLSKKARSYYERYRNGSLEIYPNPGSVVWSAIEADIVTFRSLRALAEYFDEVRQVEINHGALRRAQQRNMMLRYVDFWGTKFLPRKTYYRATLTTIDAYSSLK